MRVVKISTRSLSVCARADCSDGFAIDHIVDRERQPPSRARDRAHARNRIVNRERRAYRNEPEDTELNAQLAHESASGTLREAEPTLNAESGELIANS